MGRTLIDLHPFSTSAKGLTASIPHVFPLISIASTSGMAASSRRCGSTSTAVSNLRPLPLRENILVMLVLVRWVVRLKSEVGV